MDIRTLILQIPGCSLSTRLPLPRTMIRPQPECTLLLTMLGTYSTLFNYRRRLYSCSSPDADIEFPDLGPFLPPLLLLSLQLPMALLLLPLVLYLIPSTS